MKNSGIYRIESKIKPDRIYVGSAVNFKSRWSTHLNGLRNGTHHSTKLQRHYEKYGELDLVFIIIEPCFPEFLIIREQHYIDTLNPYFNICRFAGNTLGYKYSEETIAKIKESRKDYKPSVETKKRISVSLIGNKRSEGYKHNEQTIEKMKAAQGGENNAMFGKVQSVEARKKIGEKAKGRIVSEETRGLLSDSSKGEKNGFFGKKHSEETRKKISESAKCRKYSDETKEKMSLSRKGKNMGSENPMFGKGRFGSDNPMFGKKYTPEEKERQSKLMMGNKYSLGHKQTEEHKRNSIEGRKGYKHSEQSLQRIRDAWVIRKARTVM